MDRYTSTNVRHFVASLNETWQMGITYQAWSPGDRYGTRYTFCDAEGHSLFAALGARDAIEKLASFRNGLEMMAEHKATAPTWYTK